MNVRILALIICLFFMAAQVSFGHSGRTDENGGHWDHQTKEYHYHTKDGVRVDKEKSSKYGERDDQVKGEKNVKKKEKKGEKDKKEQKLKKDKEKKEKKEKKSDKPKKEKKVKKKDMKKKKNDE